MPLQWLSITLTKTWTYDPKNGPALVLCLQRPKSLRGVSVVEAHICDKFCSHISSPQKQYTSHEVRTGQLEWSAVCWWKVSPEIYPKGPVHIISSPWITASNDKIELVLLHQAKLLKVTILFLWDNCNSVLKTKTRVPTEKRLG